MADLTDGVDGTKVKDDPGGTAKSFFGFSVLVGTTLTAAYIGRDFIARPLYGFIQSGANRATEGGAGDESGGGWGEL